jgi:hypothetical protein
MEEPPEYDEAIARGSDRRRGCLNRSRKPAPMVVVCGVDRLRFKVYGDPIRQSPVSYLPTQAQSEESLPNPP